MTYRGYTGMEVLLHSIQFSTVLHYITIGGPCMDTNECKVNGGHGPCEDVCRNTMGSYVCECSIPGWVIDADIDRHVCKRKLPIINLVW